MKKSFAHGGNVEEISRTFGLKEDYLVDFSSNVNPFTLPPSISQVIKSKIRDISRYPDKESLKLKTALGKHLNIGVEHIVVGNGSVDIIYRAVYALKPASGLILLPAFGEYEKALSSVGAKIRYLLPKGRGNFVFSTEEIVKNCDEVDIVFLCNPNNPTGMLISRKDLEYLAEKLRKKKTMLVLDEAFIDLTEEHSLIDLASKSSNLLVLRSLTKFFGLAGLRLGYAVGNSALIKRLQNSGQPWPVNVFAQATGEVLLQDEKFRNKSKRKLLQERDFLYRHLCRSKGLKPFQSSANFILAKIEGPLSSGQLQSRLIKCGLLIRDCSNFRGLNDKYIRVAVRSRKDNLHLLGELEAIFDKENKR
ncbi:MAG: threonine-phosphate decarboxylase CobD [Smithellaceae bacterium]